MPFEWKELYCLADSITALVGEDFSSEACLRSAVSRNYYAAHHCAKIFAKANGLVFKSDNPSDYHREVIEHFSTDTPRKHLVDELKMLRQWRNSCDYDDKIDNKEFLYNNSREKTIAILTAVGITCNPL